MSAVASTGGELQRWLAPLLAELPGLAVVDAHTHIGTDDDGTACAPGQLIEALDGLGAGAVSFAFHVLHPRAERFTLAHPGVEEAFALAHEHGLPILIHAGLGIDPLGRDALRLAAAHPRAHVILAHAAITDLAWIGDALGEHPNVLFDTAWWSPRDLLALFALVPPGRILFGSDTPYGHPALNGLLTLRCARAVGLGDDEIRAVMGAQLARLLAGEALADLGPAPGGGRLRHDVLLDRVGSYLAVGWGVAMAGGAPGGPRSLVRMALDVGPRHPHHETFQEIAAALDLPPIGPFGIGGLALAAAIAATSNLPPTDPETRR